MNSEPSINFSKVTPAAAYLGEDPEDKALIDGMVETARRFIERFKWCRRVGEIYIGQAIGAVVAVLLLRIEPTEQDVDEWLWVIVGDLPPAYLLRMMLRRLLKR